MKLFISLIAIFFLIAGCGGEGEEETGSGDEKVVGDGENPDGENLAQSDSNSVSVTCVPHEIIGSGSATVPVPIQGESNLELTQSGAFDCPQVASYDCTRCELTVSPSGATSIHYSCTGQGAGSVAVRSGTFIAQIGMSCTKNEVEEVVEETVEAEGTEAEQTTDQ